jgi:hypothetical protein
MFCDACGAPLEVGQTYCKRCGKAIVGVVVPGSGRVARHAHLLAVLWIAYSALSLIAGIILAVVANTVFLHFQEMEPTSGGPPPFVRPLLMAIACALFVKAAVGIAAGVGLLQRQRWGRTLTIILGIIALFNVPFGTALGIYTLWVLMSPNADQEYKTLSGSATV